MPKRPHSLAKDLLDRSLGGLLLVLTLPLIAVLCVLVKLDSRGPAFFRQVRVGRRGKRFSILKLRTMVADAEARTGPVWAQPKDNRVTALGRFLRRSHLDEFPQLWNVVTGSMSLVGPRPERPVFVEQFANQFPDYLRRLEVKPGITGLAQVSLPYDGSVRDVRRKLAYDLVYARQVGILLDLKVLFVTARQLIFHSAPAPRVKTTPAADVSADVVEPASSATIDPPSRGPVREPELSRS